MAKNESNTDRIIRVVLAVVLVVLAFYLNLWWLGVIALVPLGTAAIGFCPLYRIFGISTCPVKTDS